MHALPLHKLPWRRNHWQRIVAVHTYQEVLSHWSRRGHWIRSSSYWSWNGIVGRELVSYVVDVLMCYRFVTLSAQTTHNLRYVGLKFKGGGGGGGGGGCSHAHVNRPDPRVALPLWRQAQCQYLLFPRHRMFQVWSSGTFGTYVSWFLSPQDTPFLTLLYVIMGMCVRLTYIVWSHLLSCTHLQDKEETTAVIPCWHEFQTKDSPDRLVSFRLLSFCLLSFAY